MTVSHTTSPNTDNPKTDNPNTDDGFQPGTPEGEEA